MTPAARLALASCRAQNLRAFRDALADLSAIDAFRAEVCERIQISRDIAANCAARLNGARLPAAKDRRFQSRSMDTRVAVAMPPDQTYRLPVGFRAGLRARRQPVSLGAPRAAASE